MTNLAPFFKAGEELMQSQIVIDESNPTDQMIGAISIENLLDTLLEGVFKFILRVPGGVT
jgi:hypothetical protein